jgi:hypothetical protein
VDDRRTNQRSIMSTSTRPGSIRPRGEIRATDHRGVTAPPGTVRVTARYPDALGSEAVAALWDIVRPASLEISGSRVTLAGVTDDEDVRVLADRIVDELPCNALHVEVTWQAGPEIVGQAGPDGLRQISGDDPPF